MKQKAKMMELVLLGGCLGPSSFALGDSNDYYKEAICKDLAIKSLKMSIVLDETPTLSPNKAKSVRSELQSLVREIDRSGCLSEDQTDKDYVSEEIEFVESLTLDVKQDIIDDVVPIDEYKPVGKFTNRVGQANNVAIAVSAAKAAGKAVAEGGKRAGQAAAARRSEMHGAGRNHGYGKGNGPYDGLSDKRMKYSDAELDF